MSGKNSSPEKCGAGAATPEVTIRHHGVCSRPWGREACFAKRKEMKRAHWILAGRLGIRIETPA
jgi:hypothetical protein